MKKMIKIRLMSFAIWFLFLISAISHSLSHALHDNDEERLPAEAKFSESLQQETLLGFDAIGWRKMGKGRKRVAVQRMSKETANDEREEEEDSSRISGLKKKSSNKSLQTSQVNDQEAINSLNSKAQAAEDHTKKRSRNTQQYSKAKSTKFSSKKPSARNEETQRLLMAAKEIADLMHKDYKDWAHRKPPINNREPLH